MSTLVLFEVEAATGMTEDLIALFQEALLDTRGYDGCQSVSVHRDQDAPERLVLVERWTSRPEHEGYLRWRADRGDGPKLAALLAGPPQVRYLDDVDA
jgi:quinol monooxygenase YgiN